MVSPGKRGRKLKAPKRGEIYLVNIDSTIGSEIRKTLPALVLQNALANRHSPVTIVAALTSQLGDQFYPTEVFLPKDKTGLTKDGVVLLNQIRTIDRKRLIRRLGVIGDEHLNKVDRALQISLGLVDL